MCMDQNCGKRHQSSTDSRWLEYVLPLTYSRCSWVLFHVLVKNDPSTDWVTRPLPISRSPPGRPIFFLFCDKSLQHSTLQSTHCIRVRVARAAPRFDQQTWMKTCWNHWTCLVFPPIPKNSSHQSTTVLMVGWKSTDKVETTNQKRILSMVKFWGSKQVKFDPLHRQIGHPLSGFRRSQHLIQQQQVVEPAVKPKGFSLARFDDHTAIVGVEW